MLHYVYFIFASLDITFGNSLQWWDRSRHSRLRAACYLVKCTIQYKSSTSDYYFCCTALYISCWITKYITFKRSSSLIPFCNNLDNFVGQKSVIILILSCGGGGYFPQNLGFCAFKECFLGKFPFISSVWYGRTSVRKCKPIICSLLAHL